MPESYEFRRSLRASRARRAAVLRKRRATRSWRSTIAVFAGTALLASVSVAATGGGSSGSRQGGVAAAQKVLGVPADGIVGPVTRAAVKRFQRRHGLVVDGIIGPATLAALGLKGARSHADASRRERRKRRPVSAALAGDRPVRVRRRSRPPSRRDGATGASTSSAARPGARSAARAIPPRPRRPSRTGAPRSS